MKSKSSSKSVFKPRTNRLRYCIFTVIAVGSLVVGSVCYSEAQRGSSKSGKKDQSDYSELTKAPSKARDRQNPLQHDSEAITAGGKLFARHCSECHGEVAEGGRRAPSLLANEVQQASPGTLFWILTNGVVRHGMPVWSKLPEPQRWQLVSYVKSLTASAPPPAAKPNQ